jgi:FSR family fosmidomycin resistance protein-like MFS transporter
METQSKATGIADDNRAAENTVFAVFLDSHQLSHLLNDTIQSVIPAIYPILKGSFHLNFSQIGLITLTFQLTASLLQPFVGLYTDHRPKPFPSPSAWGSRLLVWCSYPQRTAIR